MKNLSFIILFTQLYSSFCSGLNICYYSNQSWSCSGPCCNYNQSFYGCCQNELQTTTPTLIVTTINSINKCLDSNGEWVWSCSGLCCKNYSGCCQNVSVTSKTGGHFSTTQKIITNCYYLNGFIYKSWTCDQQALNDVCCEKYFTIKYTLKTSTLTTTTIKNSYLIFTIKSTLKTSTLTTTTIKNSYLIFSNLGFFLLFTGLLIIVFGAVLACFVLCFCYKNRKNSKLNFSTLFVYFTLF